MTKLLGFNWGRGRLQRYESVYSVYAKFSVINGISPAATRVFFDARLKSAQSSGFLVTNRQARAFSKLLDEPLSVVKTLERPDSFDLASARRLIPGHATAFPRSLHLRYCPECLRLQFHGFFHQFSYLDRCPLHEVELLEIGGNASSAYFDNKVALLIKLFREFHPDWPPPHARDSFPTAVTIKSTGLEEFLEWSEAAIGKLNLICDSTVWAYRTNMPFSSNYAFSTSKDEYLSIVTGLLDPPPTVRRALDVKEKIESNLYKVAAALDAGLAEIFGSTAKHSLLAVYKHCWVRSKQAHIGEVGIDAITSTIIKGHTACKCRWGWRDDRGWVRANFSDFLFTEYACPFRHAATHLQERWGRKSLLTPKRWQSEALVASLGFVTLLAARGVVSFELIDDVNKVEQSCADGVRLTWHLPQNIMTLLDQWVSAELEIDVSSTSDWLAAIEDGRDPRLFVPSARFATLFLASDDLMFAQWRPAPKHNSCD